jgi:hypothetical protein
MHRSFRGDACITAYAATHTRPPRWVNLRHERFVVTGPLTPNLPPSRTHPHAAAVRHKQTFQIGSYSLLFIGFLAHRTTMH